MVEKKLIGNNGECRASDYLQSRGYEIVERNWRTRTGEIDIIARKTDALIFVEVKTLPNGNADMLARELDLRKQKRIIKTSKRFLTNNRKYSNSYIRFDVIIIDMPGYPSVYHIENAFSEYV